MSVGVPALPLGLDPLIAEAKERARRRRRMLVAAAMVAVLAAAGLAAWGDSRRGGDSFVMLSRGPVTHVTGYVSTASAFARREIDYVGSSGGVTWATNQSDDETWLTTNGGRSWRYTNPHGGGLQFVDKRHGWASGRCGVERTIDGGRTWRCSSPAVCPEHCGTQSISFLDARHGFVLEGARQVTRLFRTSNGGRTWQFVSTEPEWRGPIWFVNARLGFAGDGPLGPDHYDGPPIHKTLYRTTDGGVTWSPYRVGGSNGWVEEPIGVFGGRVVLAQNAPSEPPVNGGVSINENLGAMWVSGDAGAHWLGRPVPAILPSSGIFPSALSVASPRDLAVAHGADLYMTANRGARWRDVSLRGLPSNPWIPQLAFTSGSVGWAVMPVSQSTQTLFRTTDGGRHWTPAGPRMPNDYRRDGHPGIATTWSRCGITVHGASISEGGQVVYREPGRGTHPENVPSEVRCSGSTIWVVWFNGAGMMQEAYVGARSGDGGQTWRLAFAEQNFGVKAPRGLDAYFGPWTIRGPYDAYFVGTCPACSVGALSNTVSLYVTNDGGLTFRRYAIPALTGYLPTGLQLAGHDVTVAAKRFVRGLAPRKAVTIHVG